jgi:hypothetical protein
MGWLTAATGHFRSTHHSETLHSFQGYMKVLTSAALLMPTVHVTGHRFHSETGFGYMNAIGWCCLCVACLLHHIFPASKFYHDVDHWGAQTCGNLILFHLEGLQNAAPYAFLILNLYSAPSFHQRQLVNALMILWMLLRYGSFAGYVSAIVTAALFAMQRARVPHAHSLWHIAISLLGYFTTRSCTASLEYRDFYSPLQWVW